MGHKNTQYMVYGTYNGPILILHSRYGKMIHNEYYKQ